MTRYCDSEGKWSNISSTACVVACPADVSAGVSWSSTTQSVTPVTMSCPSGYTGNMTRVCGLNGWENVNSTACQIKTCSEDQGFPKSNYSSNPVSISCPSGYRGTKTRVCGLNGWEEIIDNCVPEEPAIVHCEEVEEDGVKWLLTNAGETRTASCKSGYTGNMTRSCKSDGTWGDIETNCTEVKCPANQGFPESIYSNDPVNINCPVGYTGQMSRTCNANGTWSNINSTACQIKTCPANTSAGVRWSSTTYSVTPVTKNCPGKLVGSMTRVCGLNGWENVVNNCEACSADGDWPETTIGSSRSLSCSIGDGKMTRFCTNNGWGDINSSACKLYCPASTIDSISVPETIAGSTVKVLCDASSSSYISIKCNEDGTWGEMDKSECENNTLKTILIVAMIFCGFILLIGIAISNIALMLLGFMGIGVSFVVMIM